MRPGGLAVLLAKRGARPFKGELELPGSPVRTNEPLEKTLRRELRDSAGIRGMSLEQLGAFGEPGRDPRGHAVSIAYFTWVVAEQHAFVAGEKREFGWHSIATLKLNENAGDASPLAFDHANQIRQAHHALRHHLRHHIDQTPFELVPARFTLTELQRVYEAIFERTVDKRNFRSRILTRGLVEPVAAKRVGNHRAAQLYQWKSLKRKSSQQREEVATK